MPAILIDISHESKAYLSEIAESVDMVRLETTENSLIQEIRNVEILNNHYFIRHGVYSEILMFDLNGQFVKKVGAIGRGPGEYSGTSQILVDNESGRLLLNSYGIMIFDHNGVFVEHIVLDKNGSSANSMLIHNKHLYCFYNAGEWFYSGERESSTFLAAYNTTDWKLTDSIFFKSYIGNYLFPAYLTQSNQNIYLYSKIPESPETKSDVDTLYVVKDKRAVPYLTAQVVGKGENGGYVDRVVMTDNYGIITHSISVKDDKEPWPISVLSQYYFNLRTMRGKNATNGFIDDFYSGNNVIITPIPNTNKFYYYITDYSNLEAVPNPILYVGTFKK